MLLRANFHGSEGVNVMNESNRTGLVIAFVVVVVLFLLFGGGAMSGSFMGGDGRRKNELL